MWVKISFNYFSEICPLGAGEIPTGGRTGADAWVVLSVKIFVLNVLMGVN